MSVLQLKQTFCRRMAMVFLVLIVNEILTPSIALALTGGPSQPEVHGFEPVGTSDMVDLSTGDFNYNVPLMDAGGYPINISYHAGASADDEGSWVGLGWSLTPGAMNRDMRGLPDDFKGDKIKKEFNIKDDVTTGFNAGAKFQFLGIYKPPKESKVGVDLSVKFEIGGFYNTYRGYGIEYGVSPTLSLGQVVSEKAVDGKTDTLTRTTKLDVGASLKYNSQSGLDVDLSVGLSGTGLGKKANKMAKANVETSFNSRQGLKDLTFGTSINTGSKIMPTARANGAISFANRTYVPTNAMPMANESYTFQGTLGTALWTTHPSFELKGYKTTQRLRMKSQDQTAYGYLHHQVAQNDRSALMDYNKEKQIPYKPSQPNLPLSVGTYDLFSATGQGVSGQFRAMRNDVGTFRTPIRVNTSFAGNLGGEYGLGGTAHGGLEIRTTNIESVGSDWDNGKGAATNLTFTEQTGAASSADYEPVFIKNTGESATSSATGFRDAIGDNAPIALKIKRNNGIVAENTMRKETSGGNVKSELQPFSGAVKRAKREKRTQVFSYLTASEAAKVGIDKTIKNYPANQRIIVKAAEAAAQQAKITNIPRTNYPAHHISEVSVTQGDGSRYVYGTPAYNTTQEEASFAVEPTKPNDINGTLVTYAPNADNSVNNGKGRDNYFDGQTLPAFAHSYLLTGVVSADYVDIGNDGITDDDIGTNVKINYSKMPYVYSWRTPYVKNQGRYNEGYKSDKRDDKASYVFGKKEVWYTHSIETKTMTAQFFTSNREDGLGVIDKNGGKDSDANLLSKDLKVNKKLQKLDCIKLYSKANLLRGDTTPIKVVHFEYDYSLCKGAPNITAQNTAGGKLTLRKIYFTYGNNTSGALNKYKFTYNGDKAGEDKFVYNIDNYDRWGAYKEASANPASISNQYFPYATQDKILADKYAKGWNLSEIELPSGGQIKVKYESDDYAYVQDKRAGQMFQIKGFSRLPNNAADNNLYEFMFGVQSKYMHIDVEKYAVTDVADFKKRFLEDVKQIYFNCLVVLDWGSQEYIKGYFDLNNQEAITLSADKKTVILPMTLSPSGMNPIAKIAIQTMRLELPQLVYPGYDTQSDAPIAGMIGALLGVFPEIEKLSKGFEPYAVEKSWGRVVNSPQSWIRLANPTYKKLGGGSRVSEIAVSNFSANTTLGASPNNAAYGQRYTYTTVNSEGREISSGVASYEPMVGNEENLFREPMNYDEKVKMAPDNTYYMEKPFCESLFPSASIAYSAVKVQSIEPAGLKRTGTGYTIHAFFTAKDFPTVVDYTAKQHEKFPTSNATFSLLDIFKINKKQHVGVSQGYSIEVNDMHGKPKAEYVRNAYGADISWTAYEYRTDGANHLKNDGVDVINTEGVISAGGGTIGYDFDVWHDMQQDKTVTNGMGMSANGELFFIPLVPPIPVFIPPIFPALNREETVFRSAVTTKFVKRFGILNKVTKMENGSTVSTENLLFDSETGQPLLTKTQNEFRDEMYQFSYPAHWAYEEGMGQAYKNIGLRADGVSINSQGQIESADFAKYFVPGDELMVEQNGKLLPNRYNIVMVGGSTAATGGSKRVIDPVGTFLPTGAYSLKVMRSGRRNQASAAIGSVVSRKDPRQGTQLVFDKQILTAQAATFKDDWAVNTGKTLICTTTTTGGTQGNVIPKPNETYSQYPGLLSLIQNCKNVLNGSNKTLTQVIEQTIPNFLGYGSSDNIVGYWTGGPMEGDRCPLQYAQSVVFHVNLSETCTLNIYGYSTTDYICDESNRGTKVKASWKTAWPTPGVTQNAYLTCNTATGTTNCVVNCAAPVNAGQQVNPYQLGIKGNWRPDAAFALYAQRTSPLSISAKNLRTDGDVVNFENFWQWNGSKLTANIVSKKWVKTNTITHYDDKGNDIENYDALGIYSSALFRYQNTLASAVAANARRREIIFDGFEDYGFTYKYIESEATSIPQKPSQICGNDHFDYALMDTVFRYSITNDKAHTGNYSFRLLAGKSFSKRVDINPTNLPKNDDASTTVVEPTDHRLVKRILPRFALAKNKAFVISAWVSKSGTCTPTEMKSIQMNVKINGTTTPIACLPTGTIVDGWQRIETVFNTGSVEVTALDIEFANKTSEVAFMDDLRILPVDGKMKSFVYDARNLRLMAQLDENNYATFYEYDDEGTLVRTKRETERGIVTIQENRSTLYRKQIK